MHPCQFSEPSLHPLSDLSYQSGHFCERFYFDGCWLALPEWQRQRMVLNRVLLDDGCHAYCLVYLCPYPHLRGHHSHPEFSGRNLPGASDHNLSDYPGSPDSFPGLSGCPGSPDSLPGLSGGPDSPDSLPGLSVCPGSPESLPDFSGCPGFPDSLPGLSDCPGLPDSLSGRPGFPDYSPGLSGYLGFPD